MPVDQSSTSYAFLSKESLLKALDTSENGLSEKEVIRRLKQYGYNEPQKIQKSIFFDFISRFANPLVVVLFLIAIVSFYFNEVITAILITIMAIISIVLAFVQEYKAEKASKSLQEMVHTNVTVIRSGNLIDVPLKYVVPGDIVDLSAGHMIPADLRIISAKDFFVNQSSLTGESFPIEKTAIVAENPTVPPIELQNIAYMGSSVVSGTALGVVLKTGSKTVFGDLYQKILATPTLNHFDKGIFDFTMLMIKAMVILVCSIFVIVSFRHENYVDAFLFALGVAVGLTPEMLPMIITLTLSKGALLLSKKDVIVKQLNSIQTFGAMDVLCTDKTGTLTLNKIILEKHCDVLGTEDEDVLRYAYINSFYQTGLKNVLDKAILDHEEVVMSLYEKIDEIPFDFSRKIMSVVVKTDHHICLVSKGAPEEIFSRSTHYFYKGSVYPLDNRILQMLMDQYDALSKQGFRVLAIAYKNFIDEPFAKLETALYEVPAPKDASILLKFNGQSIKDEGISRHNLVSPQIESVSSFAKGSDVKKKVFSKEDESGLIVKGYVAFYDPPKESTESAIKALQKSHVSLKILTGDNEQVSRKICSDVGLDVKNILSGEMLEQMTDEELVSKVGEITIFSRLLPAQKERVIVALQKKGHVVGYLGDGINDAIALKAADVGISVDNGVDIAKEAADLILLKKSLMVLQDGVLEGRRTVGNIFKYVKSSSSSNFGNMLSMTLASLFLPFLPMLPVQILLNNFLYDLSQMTVPTDSVDPEYLEKPKPWNIQYIKRHMIFFGPISSFFDAVTFFLLLHVFEATEPLFHTGWFIKSLCAQSLVICVVRTKKIPFFESVPSASLLTSTLCIAIVAFLLPQTIFAPYFGFTPLSLPIYGTTILVLLSYFSTVQVCKIYFAKKFGYM